MLLTSATREEFELLYPQEQLPGSGRAPPADRETLWQMVQQDKARAMCRLGESFFRHGISSIVLSDLQPRADGCEAVVSIMVPLDEIPKADRERLRREVRTQQRNLRASWAHPPQANVG
ncbi:Uncharacterised protein [Serratia plymuthica]|nr:Uncharacterised protein [Serratia plymuthica]